MSKVRSQKLEVKRGFSSAFILLLVVIIILGIVALFVVKNMKYSFNPQPQTQQVESDEQVRTLQSSGNSDEVDAIDQDIKSTNLDNLDQGLGDVNKDIQSLK